MCPTAGPSFSPNEKAWAAVPTQPQPNINIIIPAYTFPTAGHKPSISKEKELGKETSKKLDEDFFSTDLQQYLLHIYTHHEYSLK